MSDLVPLTGEPLALDLVNTRPTVGELLATPEDLRAWVAMQAERLPGAPEKITATELAAVHAVREHAARALEHGRHGTRPSQTDLDALNEAQRSAPAISEVAWNGTGLTVTRRRGGSSAEQLAAWLAEATAELLADPAVTRIRQCEADDCVLLFLPAHPRRRWCSAARCGNRMRVARHYQRNRAG
ncbi:ABATE domain-containing protein [Streptomyces sp. NPDC042319]|uniref:CGNR zinc finger domain-containing protein n=1 Tax=Streptomyces sp. NPDC042319 TaxID=3154332 RepID=UPI0033E4AEAE